MRLCPLISIGTHQLNERIHSEPETINSPSPRLQVLVEPHNSLAEGLLLGELLLLVAQVGADGEAVRNTAEQVDLPRLAGFDQGFLGLVTELGGEDLVDLCNTWLDMLGRVS